jgi:glycosyltransferase involved in cell wall biosynthesis
MRIGIDARLWNETGVGRYIRNLISELQTIDKKNQYFLFVTPQMANDPVFDFAQKKDSKWKVIATDIKWHTVEEQLLFHKKLENEYLDLVHFPYFSIPILYNRPYVITVHDLIINHFPTGKASTLPAPVYYLKRLAYQYIIKQAAKRSQKIIAVSEATKEEIVQHLKVPKEKVAVSYEGVDTRLTQQSTKSPFGLEKESFFLFVGNAYPHKNTERLVDAFSIVLKEYPQTKLVFVGKKNYFYNRLEEKVKKLHLQDSIIFTGGIKDAELTALYRQAEALVFPSLMEGFGLPGLEAMSTKTLVLASDIPVFREVYEDAAVYFDPKNTHEIAEVMTDVLVNKVDKTVKQKKGTEIVKKFSWNRMARETLHVYESAVISVK